MSEVTSEVVVITPEMAAGWLVSNTENRSIRSRQVDALARDIAEGRWMLNGESIKLSEDGTVIDGQHRLVAIVQVGVEVPSLVVRGLPKDAQRTVDTGAARLYRDVLTLAGESNPTALAAVLRLAVVYADDKRGLFRSGLKPTHGEMQQYFEKHPEVRTSGYVGMRASRLAGLPSGPTGLVHHLAVAAGPEDAETFFEQLVEGVGVQRDTPAFVLRRRAAEDPLFTNRTAHLVCYLIHGWNLYRAGTRISKIQAPKGGWEADNMPVPR